MLVNLQPNCGKFVFNSEMNKHIYAFCTLMMSVMFLTSCLGSSDSDITYYNDAAITAFSVTTVNRYIHTSSKSGGDSIYKKAISKPVTFTIDQYRKEIYNTDSLFADCDLKHVVVAITSKNSGTIVFKSMTSDSLTVYNSSDSIDFTKPREIQVYANEAVDRP